MEREGIWEGILYRVRRRELPRERYGERGFIHREKNSTHVGIGTHYYGMYIIMLVNNFESRRIYFYFSEQTKVEKNNKKRKNEFW